eukprot:4372631-Pleurochrysis_carterae.AAC.1
MHAGRAAGQRSTQSSRRKGGKHVVHYALEGEVNGQVDRARAKPYLWRHAKPSFQKRVKPSIWQLHSQRLTLTGDHE